MNETMIQAPAAPIDFSERTEHPSMSRSTRATIAHRQEPAPSAIGFCAVYQIDGLWFAYRESDGGSTRHVGRETREEAILDVQTDVARTWAFWVEKVAWRTAGDRTPDGDRVIRVQGAHRVLGAEPSERELHGSGIGIGSSGHRFSFRLLDTGEVVQSRNVWWQGLIPAEFVDLLPDNAEYVESNEGLSLSFISYLSGKDNQ